MPIYYGDGSTSNDGRIIQVKEAYNRTITTVSSSSDTAIGGLSNSITCSEAASKVRIDVSLGMVGISSASYYAFFVIYKDGSALTTSMGQTEGSRQRCSFSIRQNPGGHMDQPCYFTYIDNPGDTSSHTYDLRVSMEGGVTARINTTGNGNNQSNYPIAMSSFTLTEIAD